MNAGTAGPLPCDAPTVLVGPVIGGAAIGGAATPGPAASGATATPGVVHLVVDELTPSASALRRLLFGLPGVDKVGAEASDAEGAAQRLAVRKTYKLFVDGGFPRSESGRTYLVHAADGYPVANAALASRTDARDAVVAARKAQPGWAGASAYNRGQVLYRVAAMLEDREGQFVCAVAGGRGSTRRPRVRSPRR